MTTMLSRFSKKDGFVLSKLKQFSWSDIWKKLTQPATTIQDEEQRQIAYLVAAIALALIIVGTFIVNRLDSS